MSVRVKIPASLQPKHPSAVKDYKIDWKDDVSPHLETSETISSQTTVASTGITVDSSALTDTNTSVTFWLSAGTHGQVYQITNKVVTSSSRTLYAVVSIEVSDDPNP